MLLKSFEGEELTWLSTSTFFSYPHTVFLSFQILESFNNNGFKLSHISLDLHKDTEKYPDNITTEFEDKWSKLGPIYRLEAKVK